MEGSTSIIITTKRNIKKLKEIFDEKCKKYPFEVFIHLTGGIICSAIVRNPTEMIPKIERDLKENEIIEIEWAYPQSCELS